MCSIWLELGDNRIPMTRNELESLAGCIRSHRDLGGLAADILDYLDEQVTPVRPNPTDDTLRLIRAIGADVQDAPVPDIPDSEIAAAMLEIGSELLVLGTDWVDDSECGFHALLNQRSCIEYWVDMMRQHGHDDFACDVESLINRLDVVLRGEPWWGSA